MWNRVYLWLGKWSGEGSKDRERGATETPGERGLGEGEKGQVEKGQKVKE